MLLQELMVTLIVVWCCVYAAWALLPAAARHGMAGRLARWRWPAPLQRRLQRLADRPGGCSGCDSGARKPPATEQRIHIHRSVRR